MPEKTWWRDGAGPRREHVRSRIGGVFRLGVALDDWVFVAEIRERERGGVERTRLRKPEYGRCTEPITMGPTNTITRELFPADSDSIFTSISSSFSTTFTPGHRSVGCYFSFVA